jgi:hypothetical protein
MPTQMPRSIHSKRFFTTIVPLVLLLLLSTTSALDYEDVEMLMLQHEEHQSLQPNHRQLHLAYDDNAENEQRARLGDAIKRKVEQQQQQKQRRQQDESSSSFSSSSSSAATSSSSSTSSSFPFSRTLQSTNTSAGVCFSSLESDQSNRYCIFDNIPEEETFLVLACPTTDVAYQEDFVKCACAIGVGEPDEAPNTDTCSKCTFCKDSTMAYDCRNVADGTCIGINCNGECISSLAPEQPLEDEVASSGAGGSSGWGRSDWGGVAKLWFGWVLLLLGSVVCQCIML